MLMFYLSLLEGDDNKALFTAFYTRYRARLYAVALNICLNGGYHDASMENDPAPLDPRRTVDSPLLWTLPARRSRCKGPLSVLVQRHLNRYASLLPAAKLALQQDGGCPFGKPWCPPSRSPGEASNHIPPPSDRPSGRSFFFEISACLYYKHAVYEQDSPP